MSCFFCDNPEEFVHVDSPEKKTIPLCRLCAAEKGIFHRDGIICIDIEELNRGLHPGITGKPKTVCPECGISRDEILQFGITGCPECYRFFREDILMMLADDRIEAKDRPPGLIIRKRRQIRQLKQFEKEMKDAVHREDYEKAAMLRDKITDLEKMKSLDNELF